MTSEAVLNELENGPPEHGAAWLALVQDLPLLTIDPAAAEIVESSIRHRLMPAAPSGDALHLALASYHQCDFLVTWNCRHLANAKRSGTSVESTPCSASSCLHWCLPLSYLEAAMTQERSDPVIDEVREVRQRISARFSRDPARLIAYYMELQERHRDRLVDRSKAHERAGESAA